MAYPSDLQYTREHEWVRIEGSNATVGITEFAQRELGEVVYVELPNVGDKFDAGDAFGSIESVKAVSEVYMPVGGTISVVNETLNDDPELINTDSYDEGWLVKITMSGAPEGLLSAAEYEDYIKEEASH